MIVRILEVIGRWTRILFGLPDLDDPGVFCEICEEDYRPPLGLPECDCESDEEYEYE